MHLMLCGMGRSGGGAAAAFSPTDISGLVLWLDAATGLYQERTGAAASTPATNADDPVGTWADQSGSGLYLVAPSDAARPLLKFVGGLPCLLFDGVDDVLEASVSSWTGTSGSLGVRYAGAVTGLSLVPVGAGRYGSTGGNGDYARYNVDGNAYARNFRSSRYNTAFSHPDDTDAHTYVQASGASDYKLYLDGPQVGTTQAVAWEAPTYWVMGIADYNGANGVPSNLYVAGAVVYEAELTGTDLSDVQGYLDALL